MEYLTYEVFKYTVRGLYVNHKFLFTLLLPLKIGLRSNSIAYEEFQTFIKGAHPVLLSWHVCIMEDLGGGGGDAIL